MFRLLSISVVATTLLVHSTAISAQDTSDSEAQRSDEIESANIEEIVVTGTRLRGQGPIGSFVQVAGQEQLESVAPVNATELTNTIPAISGFGSAPVGQNGYSHFAPNIHGLGGSATNSTLVLVNGMRMPGSGIQYGQPDPNIIPTSALERIEVLADGASSIYGSDALAGVVNYLTRSSFEGVSLNVRYGAADDHNTDDISAIFGTDWGSGGFYVAGQSSNQDQLARSSRDVLSRGDYRDIGGRNRLGFSCSPAAITTPLSGNSNIYLSPDETSTVPRVSNNAPCNMTVYGAAIPSIHRQSALLHAYQNVSDRMSIRASVNWSHYDGKRNLTPGTINGSTAFGPGSSAGDQINPYFVAPAGEPGATQQNIYWAALREDNNYGAEVNENDIVYLVGTIEYELSDRWTGSVSSAVGRSQHTRATEDGFNRPQALLALNGTAVSSGDPTVSAISGSDIIILNAPLTESNALDVWRPVGENLTSPAVLNRIYSNQAFATHHNNFEQIKLELAGTLLSIGERDVRLATGLEWLRQEQRIREARLNSAGYYEEGEWGGSRSAYSAYAEIALPLVTEDMNVSFARRIDLSVSARYDDFDIVGSTTNPKIGVNWDISDSVRLRANWAEAFVAQPLNVIGFPEIGYRSDLRAAVTGNGSSFQVPISAYPEATQMPGCENAIDVCDISGVATPGVQRRAKLGPEGKSQIGSSWSIGLGLNPSFLPNFSANATFWNQKLRQGSTSPTLAQIVSSPALRDRLTLCPTGCTQAQIDELAGVATGGTIAPHAPTVYWMLDISLANIINLDLEGVDYSILYRIPTDSNGEFSLGATGSVLTKADQSLAAGPKFSVLNTSGFNSAFASIENRVRFNVGWNRGPLAFDLFVNHTGSYQNYGRGSVTPIETNADGLPIGGGDKVASDTTVDLHGEYRFHFGSDNHAAIYFDVKNLADRETPFYSITSLLGSGVGSYGYNGFVANPIGRVISIGFRSAF